MPAASGDRRLGTPTAPGAPSCGHARLGVWKNRRMRNKANSPKVSKVTLPASGKKNGIGLKSVISLSQTDIFKQIQSLKACDKICG